ncbi:efflux RND transporter permease subunit, partial [Acinetobacter baumannii]
TEGSIQNLDDLRSVVVTVKDRSPVRVGSLAEVRVGTMTRNGVVTKSGQGEAVQGLVLGLAGANAQKVVEGVKKKLEEIQSTLP